MYDVVVDQRTSLERDADDLAVANLMLAVDDISTLVVHDSLEIVWHNVGLHEVQPIVWPMRLGHVHGQDCGRA